LNFIFCHPELVSGSILFEGKREIPDQARNDNQKGKNKEKGEILKQDLA